MAKIGKPKGSLNRKTIERLQQMNQSREEKQRAASVANPAATTVAAAAPAATVATPATVCPAALGTMQSGAGSAALPPAGDDGMGSNGNVLFMPHTQQQEAAEALHAPSFAFDMSPSASLFPSGDDHDRMEDWLPMMAANSSDTAVAPSQGAEISSAATAAAAAAAAAATASAAASAAAAADAADAATRSHSQSISSASGLGSEVPSAEECDADFWGHAGILQRSDSVDGVFPTLSRCFSKSPPRRQAALPLYGCDSLLSPLSTPTHLDASAAAALSRCSCFSTLSNSLCELQAVAPTMKQALAIEVLLTQSQYTIPGIRALFKCHHCMRDAQGLLLANMVLSRLLHWTQLSLREHRAGQVAAQVRLGRYTASREFGLTVTKLLLGSHWADLKRTVDDFQQSVDQIGFGQDDRSYLTMQARNFQQELERLDGEAPRVVSAAGASQHGRREYQ
ncbi:hypothetical protein SPI_03602 [Niveomyces insectorum RCEF 264]|uniref:Uncharacterized protein n=1 Tax=Niveomyces insectorum RCEF 264 TaxID=1081102 RepID=A0A167W7Q1_9HYPO|nr:hypothetical protein SPI_03602 [Niveomyces insectorum RCEF 264]